MSIQTPQLLTGLREEDFTRILTSSASTIQDSTSQLPIPSSQSPTTSRPRDLQTPKRVCNNLFSQSMVEKRLMLIARASSPSQSRQAPLHGSLNYRTQLQRVAPQAAQAAPPNAL